MSVLRVKLITLYTKTSMFCGLCIASNNVFENQRTDSILLKNINIIKYCRTVIEIKLKKEEIETTAITGILQ